MKTKLLVFMGALILFTACTKNESMLMNEEPQNSITLAANSRGGSSSSTDALMALVPETNRENFMNSFIFDENGLFSGAEVEFLRPYLTDAQVIDVVRDLGDIPAGQVIFQGYKPKPRGCKQNSRWICTVSGETTDVLN